jgi:hypothetical protein
MTRVPIAEERPASALPEILPPLAIERAQPFAALQSPATRVLDALADLLPTGIPATKKDIDLVERASGALRHVTETAVRIIDAQAHLDERRADLGRKLAAAADAISAVDCNIRLREALLPDQIAVSRASLQRQLRELTDACAPQASATTTPAEDDYDRYQRADDEHSKMARVATMHASNGLTRATADAPCVPYAALLFRNALERTRSNHAAAVRETFIRLREQLEAGAVTDEVCRHAAEQLQERETNARRAEGLGKVVDGLKGMAAGGAK